MADEWRLNWIGPHGDVSKLSQRLTGEGGSVENSAPYDPPPDEIDLYPDGQFEPLTVLTVAVAASLGLKLIRETIKDLRGRQALILDVSGDTVTYRIVPLNGVDHVIVKSASGVETFAVGSMTTAIEEALLKAIGK
jgi:hypothetical protein